MTFVRLPKGVPIEEIHPDAMRLSLALRGKDLGLFGHSLRILPYTLRLGRRLGLPLDRQRELQSAALLHDLGKIEIQAALLREGARPKGRERTLLKRHPEIGAAIIANFPSLAGCVEIVLHHHERWDGLGYPRGLVGVAAPLGARVVALADCVDKLRAQGVRGRALERRLRQLAGHRLNPDLVDLFLRSGRSALSTADLELPGGASAAALS